jgi:hypothetical protein
MAVTCERIPKSCETWLMPEHNHVDEPAKFLIKACTKLPNQLPHGQVPSFVFELPMLRQQICFKTPFKEEKTAPRFVQQLREALPRWGCFSWRQRSRCTSSVSPIDRHVRIVLL